MCWKISSERTAKMPETTSDRAAKVTLPTDDQILITREFDAPRHLVSPALDDPRTGQALVGPAERGEMQIADIDLRVGGTMALRHGRPRRLRGRLSTASTARSCPNERIVTTEVYEGADAAPGAEDVINVITFTELEGDRTLLELLVKTPSKEHPRRDRELRDGGRAPGADGDPRLFSRCQQSLKRLHVDRHVRRAERRERLAAPARPPVLSRIPARRAIRSSSAGQAYRISIGFA